MLSDSTCPARAGLIPRNPGRTSPNPYLSRTRGVDSEPGSHTLGSRAPAPHAQRCSFQWAFVERSPCNWPQPGWSPDHLRVCGAVYFIMQDGDPIPGSPPRVRSRLLPPVRPDRTLGITSACAEQTRWNCPTRSGRRDHLRVCGADLHHFSNASRAEGSPPRVRSRRGRALPRREVEGITSACAEQTTSEGRRGRSGRDHLRVCGADQRGRPMKRWETGSPPRVRSRPEAVPEGCPEDGITSACAEQTPWGMATGGLIGDHLRVCGADVLSAGGDDDGRWITSACAEQTHGSIQSPSASWDHLRVCGADRICRLDLKPGGGSPPRVRSRLEDRGPDRRLRGITSACAEQTVCPSVTPEVGRDHLRVCGADQRYTLCWFCPEGSPPRVRSRHRRQLDTKNAHGITSACAEQTCRSGRG